MKKWHIRDERISAYVQIVFGCFVCALAYPAFLVPNTIAPGGITGVATIINHFWGLPVGITSLVLNVPLFIMGYRFMGRVFAFRSLIATILFSLLIDFLPVGPFTDNALLGSLFGGVLLGGGLGFIIRGGATSGGSDMLARMVHSRFPHISVGAFLMIIDFMVVLTVGVVIELEYALYAFISIYASSRLIDVVIEGFQKQKACYIITQAHQAIKQDLMDKLDRGVTVLKAEGGYSGEERPILLCVASAQEVGQIKSIVRQSDESAFVFITDAFEVLGEGFGALAEKD